MEILTTIMIVLLFLLVLIEALIIWIQRAVINGQNDILSQASIKDDSIPAAPERKQPTMAPEEDEK